MSPAAFAPALLLLLAGPLARAAEPAPKPGAAPAKAAAAAATPARTVEAILKDYVEALGGQAALRRRRSLHLRRELTVEGMGVGGTEERWATADGKLLSVTELAGVGTVKVGSTGKVYWSMDPINGLRELDGVEAEQARIDATWMSELKLAELYAKVAVVPPPKGAKGKVECLELSPKLGNPTIACFSQETHLRVYQAGRQQGPQGEIPFSAELSDWRTVSGVKLPFRERMVAGPMTVVAEVTEVTFDKKIPRKLFAMPKAPGAAKR